MNMLLLSLFGALLLLDKYALGEFGISQPIITGAIIGAIFGDMWFGIFLGAVVQMIFLGGLPIGRDIPPDGQAAGIIAVTGYFLLRGSNTLGHSLFVATVLGLGGGIVGGLFDIYARRMNEKLYDHFMRHKESLYVCHAMGLLTAFGRGFLLFLPVFVFAGLFSVPAAVPEITQETLMIIGVSMGLANGLYLFVKLNKVVFLLIGGICGLALGVF